ncbi:MAG: hypothetical protein J0H63_12545, partial [Rhizobiales bacterium]|nr:hypothetical protein [Hyphomicrobiales bacterium]
EEEPDYAAGAAAEAAEEAAAIESPEPEGHVPETAAEEPGNPAGARVSDLEREMARLLGEISGRRS